MSQPFRKIKYYWGNANGGTRKDMPDGKGKLGKYNLETGKESVIADAEGDIEITKYRISLPNRSK